jgi:putative glutamine amidotransferase
MTKPIIGLCTALEKAQWSVWNQPAALLPSNYIEAIQAAGATALLLPPDASIAANPLALLDLVDGLLLAGGADIDPSFYGQKPEEGLEATVPERDAFELALAAAAMDRNQPVLGICRGLQIINVARGGTLHQDILDRVGHDGHRASMGTFDGADHDVELVAGSLAATAVGATKSTTKSHHHQSVDKVGEGLVVSGHFPQDNTCEALELVANDFTLGIQWHAEATPDDKVITAFVEAARSWRAIRS